MKMKKKMNRCFNCGEEIGAYADYDLLTRAENKSVSARQ